MTFPLKFPIKFTNEILIRNKLNHNGQTVVRHSYPGIGWTKEPPGQGSSDRAYLFGSCGVVGSGSDGRRKKNCSEEDSPDT